MSTLFLKYRPQTFAELVGQSSVRRTLQNALASERPAHAYLFAGVRGTGKTSTARIFAKGLNCPTLKDGDPCGDCDICKATAEGSLVDIVEIDAASNRGIDEIRDLREKINFAPSVASRKVYIIDEVHMLTKEAFNALLKTLEEPPDHAFFCLATTEMHKIPQTIISRCQVFTFNRFPEAQIVDRLAHICQEEKIKTEGNCLEVIARKAEGGMRDAISLLEQVSSENQQELSEQNVTQSLGISSSETLEQLLTHLQNGDTNAALTLIRGLHEQGFDFRSFGHDFLGYLRHQMLESVAKNQDVGFLLRSIEAFEKALARLKSSPIVELPLEIAVIELCQSQGSGVRDQVSEVKVSTPVERQHQPLSKPEPKPEPKPEKKSEPELKIEETKPDPAPAPTPEVQTSGDIDVKAIQSHMRELADKAELPAFVKKSFLTTVPSVEEGQLIFATDSEFHREKLDTPAHRGALSQALKEQLAIQASIQFIKRSVDRPVRKEAENTTSESASAEDFLVF